MSRIDTQQATRVGPFSALSNRGYLLFWSTSCAAQMGAQGQIAIGQWQVYSLTQSPFQLGLVGLMNVLPLIGLGDWQLSPPPRRPRTRPLPPPKPSLK